ncbi:NYN domain-containing protein [Candidatus Nomurabacteria bacterium]|nr:NYN domain-containing protein [Candidatus Nomurabacteria bacterium]
MLYAVAKKYRSYDQAIIVSGDGDFRCLVEYLIEKQKLLHVLTPTRNFSKLLREYLKFIVQIDKLRRSLEYKQSKTSPYGRSKTLGRTGKTSRSSGRFETLGPA